MPRPKLYPLTPAQIEAAIAAIIETGQHHDGKKAATPKPGYFKNFKFESCGEGGTSVVSDRNEKFRMRCARHDFSFATTTRALFSTSSRFKQTTCPFCEREAGCGRGFITLAELAQQMSSSAEF